jgi:dTDP-4-amino-4,6-dideoxygalactose transaminase
LKKYQILTIFSQFRNLKSFIKNQPSNNKMIPFNRPCYTGNEDEFVLDSMRSAQISGDGQYSQKCHAWFEEKLGCHKALLTPSCTHSLEMAALMIGIGQGDEVIMPSYTFVSTANAFALRGAKIVFVDIKPGTMNIDENLIEQAISKRTKAIVPVHYAGVSCEMDTIMGIAEKHNLYVIEDAAQGMMSTYKGRPLGSIGHVGAFSFHETKNFTSAGEGGLTIVNDSNLVDDAEIFREKGTNRKKFFRGEVDKYSWVNLGSSYLLGDISAAYLWGQLTAAQKVIEMRLAIHQRYYDGLLSLAKSGLIELCQESRHSGHNAHMFYLKTKDLDERNRLICFLKSNGITAVFHYVPLHSSVAGKRFGQFSGVDRYTTSESEKLVRLPLYYGLDFNLVDYVINKIEDFYVG